jgi:hypothetical protein
MIGGGIMYVYRFSVGKPLNNSHLEDQDETDRRLWGWEADIQYWLRTVPNGRFWY